VGFAPTWLRQVSPPAASQNHFNHWLLDTWHVTTMWNHTHVDNRLHNWEFLETPKESSDISDASQHRPGRMESTGRIRCPSSVVLLSLNTATLRHASVGKITFIHTYRWVYSYSVCVKLNEENISVIKTVFLWNLA